MRIKAVVSKHEQSFLAWSAILPLFRSTRKLDPAEKIDLLVLIDDFLNAYYDETTGSITIKIHQLCHVAEQVDTCGTVGLVAEDSAEPSMQSSTSLLVDRLRLIRIGSLFKSCEHTK
jgi:hypothetical protein